MQQQDFIEGRLAVPPCKKTSRPDSDPCTEIEKAEFRSAVGNLHWVTSQTRFDQAVNTSRFQKKQNVPKWADYKALVKTYKLFKSTADVDINVVKNEDAIVATWSDSSGMLLCGYEGLS